MHTCTICGGPMNEGPADIHLKIDGRLIAQVLQDRIKKRDVTPPDDNE